MTTAIDQNKTTPCPDRNECNITAEALASGEVMLTISSGAIYVDIRFRATVAIEIGARIVSIACSALPKDPAT